MMSRLQNRRSGQLRDGVRRHGCEMQPSKQRDKPRLSGQRAKRRLDSNPCQIGRPRPRALLQGIERLVDFVECDVDACCANR